jgi:hypothetical protein
MMIFFAMQELQAALEHTPIPHEEVIAKGARTVWYTWFETFHNNSSLSCLFEVSQVLFIMRGTLDDKNMAEDIKRTGCAKPLTTR